MDPFSALLVGHGAGKLLDAFGSGFRTNVIERWARHRAEEFFRAFGEEVAKKTSPKSEEELHRSLRRLLEDERCSEVLFDAYRRVAMSRSKRLGPRIVALLTAEIVNEKRTATDDEEALFAAAEQLTDGGMEQFVAFATDARSKCDDEGNALEVPWGEQRFDSNWKSSRRHGVSAPNLGLELGSWAPVLESLGLLVTDTRERVFDYKEDSERHIDQDGTVREISWWVLLPLTHLRLVDLIERAKVSLGPSLG